MHRPEKPWVAAQVAEKLKLGAWTADDALSMHATTALSLMHTLPPQQRQVLTPRRTLDGAHRKWLMPINPIRWSREPAALPPLDLDRLLKPRTPRPPTLMKPPQSARGAPRLHSTAGLASVVTGPRLHAALRGALHARARPLHARHCTPARSAVRERRSHPAVA